MDIQQLKDKVDMLSGALLTNAEPLPQEETKAAVTELSIPLYRRICRVKRDPLIAGQEYALFSFTPARGVKPNANGIYGTAKIRGNFATEEDAADQAERIIRTVDSANEIYTVKVGQEFPLTKEARFAAELDTVDLEKEVNRVEQERQKEQRAREKKERKTIIDREAQMLKEKKEILDGTFEEDPLDAYTKLRIKRAQLMWTLESTTKTIETEIKPALYKTNKELEIADEKNPELQNLYQEHYNQERARVGLPTTEPMDLKRGDQIDFVKYL